MIGFGNLCWWLSQYDGDDDDDDDGNDDDDECLRKWMEQWELLQRVWERNKRRNWWIFVEEQPQQKPCWGILGVSFLFAILIVYDLFIPALKFLASQTVSVTWVAFRLVLSSSPTSESGDKILLLRQEL